MRNELISVGKKTYYYAGLYKIGLYMISETEVCLIDTGIDEEIAIKLDRLIEERGWKVGLIINTHYHADHCGGNHYFQSKYKCKIYASKINAALISNYDICPAIVWGATPLNVLLDHYYYTNSTDAEDIEKAKLPEGIELLELPGHSISMLAVWTDDDVIFLGDALVGVDVLKKEAITYVYELGDYLASLNEVEGLEAKLYIPYHSEPVRDIRELVRINRENVMDNLKRIKAICKTPRHFDDIVREFFNDIDMELTLYKYNVKGGIIKTYLTYLHNMGEMETECMDNYLMWQTISR